jgi:hypothetical protein
LSVKINVKIRCELQPVDELTKQEEEEEENSQQQKTENLEPIYPHGSRSRKTDWYEILQFSSSG